MKITAIFLLFTFSILGNLIAQDLDDVFDDGGLSSVRNNINFSASDIVEGFFTVGYDRYVGQSSSVGIAFGLYLFSSV